MRIQAIARTSSKTMIPVTMIRIQSRSQSMGRFDGVVCNVSGRTTAGMLVRSVDAGWQEGGSVEKRRLV
jgi:hypothetical protein